MGTPSGSHAASLRTALTEVTSASERLARDRLRLVELDAKVVASSLPGLGAWFVVGSMCAVVAWLGVGALAVLGLAPLLSLPAALGTVAAVHGLGAALCLAIGRRSTLRLRHQAERLKESLSFSPGEPAERRS